MTAQVLQFPVIPIKPADRLHPLVAGQSRYQCPECGTYRLIEHGPLFAAPLQICDSWHGCGAEMRPVEAK